MVKHTVAKAGLVAIALVLGSAALSSSKLMASGYMVGCGRDGEATCQPGGTQDCPANS
jgi:hypothetical protein